MPPIAQKQEDTRNVMEAQDISALQDSVFDKDFWHALAPNLKIDGEIKNTPFISEGKDAIYNRFIKEGYVHLSNPGLDAPLADITDVFAKIVALGLPPVFAFVFDEMWSINQQISDSVSHLLGGGEYYQMPDFWAWRVEPGQAGWKPHRDKLAGSMYEDEKTPKSITVWIPLTQAHPLNGCMYVVPADRDPHYGKDNAPKYDGCLSDIRALPAEAGDVLLWTQHVYHWGAHSADEHDLSPRMSMAFEYQRTDVKAFNRPLLDPFKAPKFEDRLSLIAKQIVQYTHMYGFSDDLVDIAEEIVGRFGIPKSADI